jgi:hypothetical protein
VVVVLALDLVEVTLQQKLKELTAGVPDVPDTLVLE